MNYLRDVAEYMHVILTANINWGTHLLRNNVWNKFWKRFFQNCSLYFFSTIFGSRKRVGRNNTFSKVLKYMWYWAQPPSRCYLASEWRHTCIKKQASRSYLAAWITYEMLLNTCMSYLLLTSTEEKIFMPNHPPVHKTMHHGAWCRLTSYGNVEAAVTALVASQGA